MRAYEKVFVEGKDDRDTLMAIFPIKATVEKADNKAKVRKSVEQTPRTCGIVDRDFELDKTVAQSRQEGSRCVTLQRYALENYLIEPSYLMQFAQTYQMTGHPNWQSEDAIRSLLVRKAQELCHYAAANELLGGYSKRIAFQQLTSYFDDVPVIEETAVREVLNTRFKNLPTRDDLVTELGKWEQRAGEIRKSCESMEGINRWINGKVLLRHVLYQDVVAVNPEYSKRSKSMFVLDLAGIAKDDPPKELREILCDFGITILPLA